MSILDDIALTDKASATPVKWPFGRERIKYQINSQSVKPKWLKFEIYPCEHKTWIKTVSYPGRAENKQIMRTHISTLIHNVWLPVLLKYKRSCKPNLSIAVILVGSVTYRL